LSNLQINSNFLKQMCDAEWRILMDTKRISRLSSIVAVVAFAAISATHLSSLNAVPTAFAQQQQQKFMAKLIGNHYGPMDGCIVVVCNYCVSSLAYDGNF
jgi:hypothetical protein